MDGDDEGSGHTTLSPDEAFAVLGNETRVEILRTLGDAGEPLSFTVNQGESLALQGGDEADN